MGLLNAWISEPHADGLVIFTGLGIGTLFTLFVVPAVYVLLARDRNPAASR